MAPDRGPPSASTSGTMAPDRGPPSAFGRIPFTTLMALKPTGKKQDEYESLTTPFAPGMATYGGHVLAQAVWAAAQTVRKGFVVHNMHCYFTLPGNKDLPFIYTVTRTRDGGRYSTRSVTARQPDETGEVENSGACFVCICSFKVEEESNLDHQVDEGTVEERYAGVLGGKRPWDWKGAPVVDVPWFREYARENNLQDETPGVDVRKVEMGDYNDPARPVEKYRQLQYYTTIGAMPDDLNLHACAHLYASDRNSLFVISNAHAIQFKGLGSLSHSVLFHGSSEGLRFGEGKGGVGKEGEDGKEREEERTWFCQEAWTERAGGARGVHTSKIWDAKGRHVATTWQDGMVRAVKL